MTAGDWLVGGQRREIAAERIYAAAADLIALNGWDGFDVDELAARVHCSRATVYRHVGGKGAIRDVVLARAAEDVVASTQRIVAGLSGQDRIVTAITFSLERVRSHLLGSVIIDSLRTVQDSSWIADWPVTAKFACELLGLSTDDLHVAEWVVRCFMSLLLWPMSSPDMERDTLIRVVSGALAR